MPRNKLMRYRENTLKKNVLEPGKPHYETIRGHWQEVYFGNQHPITVELGCGGGEYTTGLATQFPDRNFVGIDVKGERMWRGAGLAEALGLNNVAFLRGTIDFLEKFFAPGEISEIWIPFPDPRPKEGHEKRRLTHPRYLTMYRNLMQPGGIVHFKTDNGPLFEYTRQILTQVPVQDIQYTHDLYQSELVKYQFGIQTKYEQQYIRQGFKIHYLQFKFKDTDGKTGELISSRIVARTGWTNAG